MKYLIILLMMSCSLSKGLKSSKNEKIVGSHTYDYTDSSGEYILKREIKKTKNNLITRVKILSKKNLKELESQVSVSILGSVPSKKGTKVTALLPSISQFKVWFNKEEYFSQIKSLRKQKKIQVILKSPEKKWNSETLYDVPSGNYFCFFSQIPECLKVQNLLLLAAKKKVQLFVVWDNFPYHNEQYEGLSNEPITSATVELDRHDKKELIYSLDLGNQVIFYHFNKNLKFRKMFWVSQGIRVLDTSKE